MPVSNYIPEQQAEPDNTSKVGRAGTARYSRGIFEVSRRGRQCELTVNRGGTTGDLVL